VNVTRSLAESFVEDVHYILVMTKIERLEREVAALSPDELDEFRRWFAEFDAATWDERLAADAQSGALDRVADEALADHRAGRSRPL
jgi:hypothetical protein